MTKTSIFWKSEVKQEEKKPIEFVKHLNRFESSLDVALNKPSDWDNLTLLERSYTKNLDLIWAYDENPNDGTLYLGHWNDGIVK